MRAIRNRWVFLASIVAGLALALSFATYVHFNKPPSIPVQQLTEYISVTEQLTQESMEQLKNQGFATVIDLRPDGEVLDQPSSETMARAATRNGMHFYYVPVPHGAIPDQSVRQLATALRDAPKPVIMYCRSGKRAARTWSLVEASRYDGLDSASIMAAVAEVGHSADDLRQDIKLRIAQRPTILEQQP